jgi:transcriptional regulator with XRE-family HTH domain
MNFGAKIRKLRLNKNLNQTEMVKILRRFDIEISRPTLVNWEQSDAIPRGNIVIAYCKIFGVQPVHFFGAIQSSPILYEFTNIPDYFTGKSDKSLMFECPYCTAFNIHPDGSVNVNCSFCNADIRLAADW